jgi:hypothetical protein
MDRDPNAVGPMEQEYWTMYFNGSLMKSGARARLVFISPLGARMRNMT